MSVATTAELIVEIIGKDLLSPATASAERGLSTMSGTSLTAARSASTAERAFGLVGSAATGMGNALNHAKGFLGSLVSGPLGMLGLGAAAFSVAGALKSGIDTANGMALAMEKLQALTGESAVAMSGLLAVTGKFGITSQAVGTIVGFEEKTVGKLAETTAKATKAGVSAALQKLEDIKLSEQAAGASTKVVDKLIAEQKARDALTAAGVKGVAPLNKLVALQQQYGVTLTNSKGQALDFSTILNHVSDYYNSNATQGQKAALAATLFGRGYAALIPVLQLGSAGFAKAQQAAVSLGLTLTSQNAVDLKNYQENWRELGDAVGGLQLQMSLALLPTLNDVAKSITAFVGAHKSDLIDFFKGAIGAAREIGGALVAVGTAAAGAWNAIPPQLRTLLIEALIGNKVIKTVFGINILGTVEGAVADIGKKLFGSLIGSIFGKTIATPVVNVDGAVVNVGGVGGALAGAAGGAEAGAAEAAGGAGILETIGGAGFMAIVAPLAVAAAVPLILNQIANGDPAKTGANDLAARQTIAAGRGLNPANVPTDITGRRSAAPGAGPDYGAIVGAIKSTGLTAQQTALAMGAKIAASAKTFEIAAAISHLSSLTVAQMNTLSGSLQLQRVAIIHGGTMTYTELLHQSAVAHADHISNQAHIDGITVAAEKIKMAALATAANVALTTAAVKASAGIIGTMIGGRLDELPSGPATPMPPAGLSAHQLHLLHVSVTTSPTSAAKVTTTAKAVGAKKVGVN